MTERYARIRRALFRHPWAITETGMELVLEVLDRRFRGELLDPEEKDARIAASNAARPERGSARSGGGVKVIPISGLIMHRAHMVQDISGPRGTSTEIVGRQIEAALSDRAVDAIVLDVDSPGGSSFGVEELGDQIFAARGGDKPIVAVANAFAGSAAYWIASQADELVVTPSGSVGSIGVYAMHENIAGMAEQLGVEVTFISAGRYKVEGHPFESLPQEAREFIQGQVDDVYSSFVRAVARGRRTTEEAVIEDMGEGRMLMAQRSLEAKMVDRVETMDQTIERLRGRGQGRRSRTRAEDEKTRLRLAQARR